MQNAMSLQRSGFYSTLSKEDAPDVGPVQLVSMALALESLVGK